MKSDQENDLKLFVDKINKLKQTVPESFKDI